MAIVSYAKLKNIAKEKVKPFNGRVSANAVNLMNEELAKITSDLIEHAWVETEKAKKKTISGEHMIKSIETTRLNQYPGLVDILILKLVEMKKEIEKNDARRKLLFSENQASPQA